MFKKLLSNLPFNPSLIGQVSFYAQRIKQESAIRRTGLVFMALTMMVQFFAVVAPPQPTLARSGNDIIPGGVTSVGHAVEWCNTNLEIKTIFAHFGVSCAAIQSGSVVNVGSRNWENRLYSLGRWPYQKPGEVPVQIGAQTFYMRPLSSWDTAGESVYRAIQGWRADGSPFYILMDCGNITIVGAPTTPPPPPPPPQPPQEKCPLDQSILKSDSRCAPCPYNNSILAGSGDCKPPVCPYDRSITADNPRCTVCPYDSTITKSDSRCQRCPYPGLTGISIKDAACKEPCPYNQSISKDDSSCKPCEASEDQDDATACVVLRKQAANVTQDIDSADGTMAKAGDVITYSLSAENTGLGTVEGFSVEENIGDLLEYAEVVDFHDGSWDEDTNIVRWPARNLSGGETMTEQLTVKIKDPIPQTPVSTSNPGSGDLTMTNVYGNAINIKLPPTVVKTTEQVVRTLPNTGPGTNIAIAVSLTIVVSYFFARTRLMAQEIDIVRSEYAVSGSY